MKRSLATALCLLLIGCSIPDTKESEITWIADEDAYYYTNEYRGNQFVSTMFTLPSGHIDERVCIFPPSTKLTVGEIRKVKYTKSGLYRNGDDIYLCEANKLPIKEEKTGTVPDDARMVYVGEVIQVGGVGSQSITKNAWNAPISSDSTKLDASTLVFTSFNTPEDLMWASCATGFFISKCTSPTGNNVVREKFDCGLSIEDKLQNIVQIECTSSSNP